VTKSTRGAVCRERGRIEHLDAARIAELLYEAAETHHVVYRISDGEDSDWAAWYADWLLTLSTLRPSSRRFPCAAIWFIRSSNSTAAIPIGTPTNPGTVYARGLIERVPPR
jgi:hypothetical protein